MFESPLKLGDVVIFLGPLHRDLDPALVALAGRAGRITGVEHEHGDTTWTVWMGGDMLIRCHEDEMRLVHPW